MLSSRPGLPTDIEERALGECVVIIARAMPGSPAVSIALRAGAGLRTMACSHAWAGALDELQSAAGRGPSIDAADSGEPVTIAELGADSRWRHFAAGYGLRCLHAEPLTPEDGPRGVLTLYSDREGGIGEEARAIARMIAEVVGVLVRTALDAARQREIATQLKEALARRAIIDQALGILMARRRCTSGEAFETLRQFSQDTNVKLHQVATVIVEQVTGEPPQSPRFEDPPPH